MIVETKHGDFEVNEITRKQRRDHYKEVKKAFNDKNDLMVLNWETLLAIEECCLVYAIRFSR